MIIITMQGNMTEKASPEKKVENLKKWESLLEEILHVVFVEEGWETLKMSWKWTQSLA